MNKLPIARRGQILGMMVEGMSIRATTRLTGASKNTVAKLLVDAGQACAEYQDKALRNLTCKRVQVDEIWAFCYAKQKNVPEHMKGDAGVGDLWTWTAIDADTKPAVSWLVGNRGAEAALPKIETLAATSESTTAPVGAWQLSNIPSSPVTAAWVINTQTGQTYLCVLANGGLKCGQAAFQSK